MLPQYIQHYIEYKLIQPQTIASDDESVDVIIKDIDDNEQNIDIINDEQLIGCTTVAGNVMSRNVGSRTRSTNNNNNNIMKTIQILNIIPMKSGQQEIYLIQIKLLITIYNNNKLPAVDDLRKHENNNNNNNIDIDINSIFDAIQIGNNYIIIKIWINSSRWWNCYHPYNSNDENDNNHEGEEDTLDNNNDDDDYRNTNVNGTSDTKSSTIRRQQEQQQQQRVYIAQQEVNGYQCVFNIFTAIQQQQQQQQQQSDSKTTNTTTTNTNYKNNLIRIPRILYFSHINHNDRITTCHNSEPPPWAILEYVGPFSLLYNNNNNNDNSDSTSSAILSTLYNNVKDDNVMNNTATNPTNETINDNAIMNSQLEQDELTYDTTYINSMIPLRMEYGYNEQHLRWGRLPISYCIPYTIHILQSFIIPLHLFYYTTKRNHIHSKGSCYSNSNNDVRGVHHQVQQTQPQLYLPTDDMKIYYFKTMMDLYRTKYTSYIKPNLYQLIKNGDIDGIKSNTLPDSYNIILQDAIQMLHVAIESLDNEYNQVNITNLNPVLCHMDLQPQNLIFAKNKSIPNNDVKTCVSSIDDISNNNRNTNNSDNNNNNNNNNCILISILDWEEAAYADPRFELLLLCRKVCANHEQAQYIWNYYETHINQQITLIYKNDVNKTTTTKIIQNQQQDHHNCRYDVQKIELGNIELWFKLEIIHTITTLLLECLAGGGRGCDKNKNYSNDTISMQPYDMIQTKLFKIKREYERLFKYGYTFCNTNHWEIKQDI